MIEDSWCGLNPTWEDAEMFLTFAPRLKTEDTKLCPGSGPSKFLNTLPSLYHLYQDVTILEI